MNGGPMWHILIVDDSVSIVKYLENIINKRMIGDFSVCASFNAEEALIASEILRPDLVFLDINLPRMNGIEACKKFREKFPTLPIIIITSQLEESLKQEALNAGATSYIIKPFNITHIASEMEKYLFKQA